MNPQQLLKLGQTYGTPLYVYHLPSIRARIAELRAAFGHETRILYAVKANFNPSLVREIIRLGCGIDAVSIEEVELALTCGARPEQILLTENNMTDAEMILAQRLNIMLNVGSLSRLRKFGNSFPGSQLCIRINPEIGDASHATNLTASPSSKFGIPVGALDEALAICQTNNLKIVGLHQHVGSGWLDYTQPLRAWEITLRAATKIPTIKWIDFGGGFGVPHKPEDRRLDLLGLARSIQQQLQDLRRQCGRKIGLAIEPGRYIVAEAGYLLTEVNTIKTAPDGRVIVGTNTGMNHLVRPAMYRTHTPQSDLQLSPSRE